MDIKIVFQTGKCKETQSVDVPYLWMHYLLCIKSSLIALAVTSIMSTRVAYASPTYTFTTIDAPDAIGDTFVYGVNASGQVVGYYYDAAYRVHNFLFTPGVGGGFTPIQLHTATDFYAFGVNVSDNVSGETRDIEHPSEANTHGFLFKRATSDSVTPIDVGPAVSGTHAEGLNNEDQVAGWYEDASGDYHGFLFTPGSKGGYIYNAPAGKYDTCAFGVNDVGQIVGYYRDVEGHFHGFIFTPGTRGVYTVIDAPAARGSDNDGLLNGTIAEGINIFGQTVGFYISGRVEHGFLRMPGVRGGFITIDVPGATKGTRVNGINASDQISGYYQNASGTHGFLATPRHLIVGTEEIGKRRARTAMSAGELGRRAEPRKVFRQ